jgi:hypothetical protein
VTALTAPDVDIALAEDDHEWAAHSLMRQLTAFPVTIRRVHR